jgi:hypothetical protein
VSRRHLIIGSIALVLGAVAWLIFSFDEPPRSAHAGASGAAAAPDVTGERSSAPTVAATPVPMMAAQRSYAADFRTTENLLEFAREMHALAGAGDTVAMYYLYAAHARCGTWYSIYFTDQDNRELTLDEALEREASATLGDPDEDRSLHRQCRHWKESPRADFNDVDTWLEKSANAGYPPAQAYWASHLLTHRGNHENPSAQERVRARELTLAALQSRDPDAYYEAMLNLQRFLPRADVEVRRSKDGDDDDIDFVESEAGRIERQAWYYAACFRGVDCGPTSRLVRVRCSHDPACQPYEDGFDLLRRGPHANLAGEIERRARELSDLIDAGRWSDLGIRD